MFYLYFTDISSMQDSVFEQYSEHYREQLIIYWNSTSHGTRNARQMVHRVRLYMSDVAVCLQL